MAKNIIDAEIVIKNIGQGATNYVRATVEMPASEWAAFIVIGGLTNQVPARTTTRINDAGDTGPAQ